MELWFDFSSNYSYLSVMRVEEMAARRSAGVCSSGSPLVECSPPCPAWPGSSARGVCCWMQRSRGSG
jgi:hypothetical protein